MYIFFCCRCAILIYFHPKFCVYIALAPHPQWKGSQSKRTNNQAKKILSHTWIDLFHFDTSLLSLYFNSVRYFGEMILSSLHFTSQFEVFFCNFRSFFAERCWGSLFHLFSTDSSNPIHTKNTWSTFYLMINGIWLLSQISIRNTRIKTHFPSILWNFIIYQI